MLFLLLTLFNLSFKLQIILYITIGFFIFLLIRALVPRYRLQNLLNFFWKYMNQYLLGIVIVYVLFFTIFLC